MNHDEIIRLRRLWNLSRAIANRLQTTTVADLRELLAKIPPECDTLPAAGMLSISAACDFIKSLTDDIASYAQGERYPDHLMMELLMREGIVIHPDGSITTAFNGEVKTVPSLPEGRN